MSYCGGNYLPSELGINQGIKKGNGHNHTTRERMEVNTNKKLKTEEPPPKKIKKRRRKSKQFAPERHNGNKQRFAARKIR